MHYSVTAVVERKYKKCNPIRLIKQNPLDTLNGEFRLNLECLKADLNLSPDEQKANR